MINSNLSGKANSSHNHDDRYWASSSGKLTLNSSCVTAGSQTVSQYYKIGRIVLINLYDINIKAGYHSEDSATFISGLPKPIKNFSLFAVLNVVGVGLRGIRLMVTADGKIKPWYCGDTIESSIMALSFVYISAS